MKRRTFVTRIAVAGGAFTFSGLRFINLRAQSDLPKVQNRIGIVLSTTGNAIHVRDSSGPLTISVTSQTRIWKGRRKGSEGADIGAIHPGDEISVRGVPDVDGRFIASQIWINIVSIDGIIARVNGSTVDILPGRPSSAGDVLHIRLTDETVTTRNNAVKKSDIQTGRYVHIIGLALEDGTIQATKFTVYANRKPVDSIR